MQSLVTRIIIVTILSAFIASSAQYQKHIPVVDRKLYRGSAQTWRWRTAYTPIFNGNNFDGWQVQGTSRWTVENQSLVGRPVSLGNSKGVVISEDQYENFLLKFQFSIEPNPNASPEDYVDSGVFFRVPSHAQKMDQEGYEMELPAHDDVEEPVGSIRHLARAYRGLAHFNFWNDCEILCSGDFIRVVVNGQIASETFDRRSLKGHIAFQHRKDGGVVRFRNIEIQSFPETLVLPPAMEEILTDAPGEFQSLFNGKDLAGWSTPGKDNQSKWHVTDGSIVLSPGSGSGYLVNNEKFENFILKLKFFMPDDGTTRDGNSGIKVRNDYSWPAGLEVQIENVRDHSHWNASGSIYNVSQGLFGWFKYNDWNEYTIYMLRDRISVYLNGHKTAAACLTPHVGKMKTLKNPGHIKIQSHAPYRPIKVKDIIIKPVNISM